MRQHGSIRYVPVHLGMPFGTLSAGAGWHRLINLPMSFMGKQKLVVAGRYVDDILGSDLLEGDVMVDG